MMVSVLAVNPSGKAYALGDNADVVSSAAEALRLIKDGDYALMAVFPGEMAIPRESLIRRALAKSPLLSVVLIGEPCTEDTIAETLVDLILPEDVPSERLRGEIHRLLETRRLQLECDLVGKSTELKAISELIYRVAPTDLPVLIIGESGTGKELVAQAIHKHSKRSRRAFLAVNSAAIPEGTLESELFGHEKGSFTGASSKHEGYFEQADGGTIFLDEIGELPQNIQARLLRVLETGDFMRVGGSGTVHADVRLLAATNIDLTSAVVRRVFREDLYYRLSAVKINIPPLRQRRKDIPVLVNKFVSEVRKTHGDDFGGFSDGAISAMIDYHWPGNVRELKNLVENAVLLAGNRQVMAEDLESYFLDHERIGRALPILASRAKGDDSDYSDVRSIERALSLIISELRRLEERVEELSQRLSDKVPKTEEEAAAGAIRRALVESGFDKKAAAEELGISLRTLYRKMKKYGIE
ncbi:MAG: sigma-54 interaction domain-containing protein [bacterium]